MGGVWRSTVSGNKAIDIIESLKSTILNGGFDVSKPLPSAAALMKKFGVARGTVDRAMRELEHAGLIERRKGSGTYAIEKKPTLFGVIVPNADQPFFTRVCTGISNCAKIAEGGGYIRFYGLRCRLGLSRASKLLRRCAWMLRLQECSSAVRATQILHVKYFLFSRRLKFR
jgi:DNA-binding transcriptional regulator YhcF (GntR family)